MDSKSSTGDISATQLARTHVLEPHVLPFHTSTVVQGLNRFLLAQQLGATLRSLGIHRPYVLVANPVAAYYLNGFEHERVGYLRLDDYPRLPGVDPDLACHAEARMRELADVCLATAYTLVPEGATTTPWHTLPQGVDVEHFASVPTLPSQSRVLGFFGLLAEWVDYELIREVARANPTWTLELLGSIRYLPESVASLSNVRVRPAVPYAALPAAIAHWSAAWLPFVRNELTRGVNPLKLREYLAAGLPAFSTPLPAAEEIPHVTFGVSAEAVGAWLNTQVPADTVAQRIGRRSAMRGHSWRARAARLHDVLVGQDSEPDRLIHNGTHRKCGVSQ